MPVLFRTLFVLSLLGLAACASPTPAAIAIASSGLTPATSAPAPRARTAVVATARETSGFVQVGEATWYGKKFHGRRTASGEIYDMNGLTAAHADLPMGAVVQVTNLDNGRRLRLKVNDRLPAKTAVLDVSARAARELGFYGAGRADVLIEGETNLAALD